MPFIRTYIPQDTSPFARESIVQGIHQALMDSIGMPSDELFNLVTGYAPGEFACSRTFNGVSRSDRVVVIDIRPMCSSSCTRTTIPIGPWAMDALQWLWFSRRGRRIERPAVWPAAAPAIAMVNAQRPLDAAPARPRTPAGECRIARHFPHAAQRTR